MKEPNTVYEKAKKRVETLKGFYNHLITYLIVNSMLIVARYSFGDWLQRNIPDDSVQEWLDLNVFLTPLIWGLALVIHGIYAHRYKFGFLKRWEARKMAELLNEEDIDNRP